jgi:hypothetical protein
MELTTRQWKLYELLKDNADKWLTQREIYERLKDQYGTEENVDNNFHDSGVRYFMTIDIRRINESGVIQKIILSTPQGIKIANEDEYKAYSINRWKSIKGMIKRLAWKDHKAKLNGQMRLVFGDSMARDYFETFAEEYEEGLK